VFDNSAALTIDDNGTPVVVAQSAIGSVAHSGATTTVTITSAIGQIFDAAGDLVIGSGPGTTVLATAVTNAASVTTPNAVGTLDAAVYSRWTLTTNAIAITELQGVVVTQGSSTGTLYTSVDGTSVTSIVISSASGVQFDALTNLLVGGTQVFGVDVSNVANTVQTSSVTVTAKTGVVFDTATNLIIGSTSVLQPTLVGASGVDGPMHLKFDADALTDIGFNTNPSQVFTSITENPDLDPPRVVNATLHLSTGILNIEFDEFIDKTPVALVDLSQIDLADTTGGNHVPLDGSGIGGTTSVIVSTTGRDGASVIGDGFVVRIQLDEHQRIAALLLSETEGGDGTPLRLDVGAGAVRDIAQNSVSATLDFPVVSIRDLIPPTLINATFDYSNGNLVLTADEYLDYNDATYNKVILSRMWLSNAGKLTSIGGGEYSVNPEDGNAVNLDGASVSSVADLPSITITLLESQRAKLQRMSGTPGGDGTPIVLDILKESLFDMSNLTMPTTAQFSVLEFPDVVPPVVSSVAVHVGTGVIGIQMSEHIKTASVDLTKLYLSNEMWWTITTNPQGISAVKDSVVTQSNGYATWTMTINTQTLDLDQGVLVTQSSQSGTGRLAVALTGVPTQQIIITAALGQVFDTGANLILNSGEVAILASAITDASVATVPHATGNLKTALTNIWTFDINSVIILHAEGDPVTQDNGYISWSITINSATLTENQGVVVSQSNGYMTWTIAITSSTITEIAGGVVTQASNSGANIFTGTLKTELTGANTEVITIQSAIGQVFNTTRPISLPNIVVAAAKLQSASSLTTPDAAGTLHTALIGYVVAFLSF
jgi:hypothetical protein